MEFPAKREDQELIRWRGELVAILRDADLPVCSQASLASNPDTALSSALGSARASTIRKHVREFRKLRAHCLATSKSGWPRHVGVFLDYLHERRIEPCARTVPAAILSCLSFVEKAGGVPAAERLSDMQMVKNSVNQCTAELETGAEPKRQAPMLPVAAVVSLELLVVNEAAELCVRGFAFYKLLKLWTACRTSDLSGLNPSTLRLTSLGLQGMLDRTKVSGPGKRIRYLPIFVSRRAFIAVSNWLSVGWEIWSCDSMRFERDFFLPLPNSDRSGVRRTMADYAQTVALTKSVWRMRPNWQTDGL